MNGFRNTPGYPTTYIPGKWGFEVHRTPTQPRPPWEKPWASTPPSQRQIDIAQQIATRRSQEQAQRQVELARARERAVREAQERQREAERARQREQQPRQAIERVQQQQREQQHRIQQEVLREFQAMLARNKRLNFEMRRRARENQKAGTWLGTALAGMVPPGYRRYAMRRPLEDTMHGVQGKELIFAQAERVGKQVQFAMEDFSFWVEQVASIACGALGGAGVYIASVGTKQAMQALKKPIATFLTRQIASSSGRMAREVGGKSTDQVLMACRDEATRITKKLFQQDLLAGTTETPQKYGDIIDAIFKSLVQQSRRDGLLPQTIRTAPPPAWISGIKPPAGGAVDVWDAATGIGWDVFPAHWPQAVDHDQRYLFHLKALPQGEKAKLKLGKVMPDGTRLRDLRPLVYHPRPKDWK